MKVSTPLATAVVAIRAAIEDAMAAAETAVDKAIRVGYLLIETKPLLGHGNFQDWIEKTFTNLPYRTAARWMQAAERTLAAAGIDAQLLTMPVSEMLATPAAKLPAPAREAQQLLLDFTAGKTIRDCLAAVVVDGDEPHRITRAANGQKHGGHRGEDRKDFPKFIGEKLSDVTAHLKRWKTYTPAQVAAVQAKFDSAIGQWPTAVLQHIKEQSTKELKTR